MEAQADLNLFMLAMMNKELKGCLYGSGNPRADIPRLLDLYRDGVLKLDELVTETYTLDEVNEGYATSRPAGSCAGSSSSDPPGFLVT